MPLKVWQGLELYAVGVCWKFPAGHPSLQVQLVLTDYRRNLYT